MVFVRSFVQSGAKINISDSSCPERIVTVTGTTEQIYKAFSMITKKFEDVSIVRLSSVRRASRDIMWRRDQDDARHCDVMWRRD